MKAPRHRLAVLLLLAPLACAASADPPDLAPRGLGLLDDPRAAPAQRVADPRAAGLLRAPARSVLPAKWDARDLGWVSPAKDQQATGSRSPRIEDRSERGLNFGFPAPGGAGQANYLPFPIGPSCWMARSGAEHLRVMPILRV